MTEAPDLIIWINTATLSDGSEVFSVKIDETTIECVTDGDAEDLARGIARLINQHSNQTAGVMYG